MAAANTSPPLQQKPGLLDQAHAAAAGTTSGSILHPPEHMTCGESAVEPKADSKYAGVRREPETRGSAASGRHHGCVAPQMRRLLALGQRQPPAVSRRHVWRGRTRRS